MRNRAKCALCKETLESFHETDYVACKCGEISITGGAMRFMSSAKDYSNFLRLDDDDNEIPVKVIEKGDPIPEEASKPLESDLPKRDQLLNLLDEMIKDIEKMPDLAMRTPVSHYDHLSLLLLLSSILRA